VAPVSISLPDADAMTVDLASAVTSSAALGAEMQLQAPADLNVGAQPTARSLFAPVNAATRAVASLLEALQQGDPQPVDGELQYGPAEHCVLPGGCAEGGLAEFTLRVLVVDPSESEFRVRVRPVGGTARQEVQLALGWARKATDSIEGQLSIDLDELRTVVAWPQAGQISLGFARVGGAKAISFRLHRFSDASVSGPSWYRTYTAYRTAAGVTRVRATDFVDLFTGPHGHELESERLVTDPAYGERSFSLVTNWVDFRPHGDVPYEGAWSENAWYRRSCARLDGAWVEEWFLCSMMLPLADCIAAGPAYASGPVDATWASTCAVADEPAALVQPTTVSFDPADPSEEAGFADLGIVSPPAP
jgi:hypothetical protein